MLEYISELMKDTQDFEWASVKDAHVVLLYRMEEDKVNWKMTEKIDRIRKAHTQKAVNNSTKKSNAESQGVLCKFYQTQKCYHKGDNHILVVSFIDMYVVSAAHFESNSHILQRIVEIPSVPLLIEKNE